MSREDLISAHELAPSSGDNHESEPLFKAADTLSFLPV